MSYFASAVHFDTSTFLSIASLSCPAATTNFSWSMWIRRPGSINYCWAGDGEGAGAPSSPWYDGGTRLQTQLYGEGAGEGPLTLTMPDEIPVNEWHHVLWSISTNGTHGNKVARCFLDDVEVSLEVSEDQGGPFNIQSNGYSFEINAYDGSSKREWDVADLWIAPGVSLLSGGNIPEATRRLFIDENRKPVDPSGFPSGAMLFSGDASAFGTNQGAGGTFTTTGTLTNASSSPSD